MVNGHDQRSMVTLEDVELSDIPREHFVDGIHLTQAGNVWVAERFAAAIEARR